MFHKLKVIVVVLNSNTIDMFCYFKYKLIRYLKKYKSLKSLSVKIHLNKKRIFFSLLLYNIPGKIDGKYQSLHVFYLLRYSLATPSSSPSLKICIRIHSHCLFLPLTIYIHIHLHTYFLLHRNYRSIMCS